MSKATESDPHLPFTTEQREALRAGVAALGLTLDEQTREQLAQFANLLAEGNMRLNLTRIPQKEVVPLHFLDSLTLASVVMPVPNARLLDVGTGAGFPGVPLALVFPNMDVTLLDATRKRLHFLNESLLELGVTKVKTVHGRAEELVRNPIYHEAYDLVTARAVAKLDALAGWLLPFTRIGGMAVAYKSREIEAEIAEARSEIARYGAVIEQVAEIRDSRNGNCTKTGCHAQNAVGTARRTKMQSKRRWQTATAAIGLIAALALSRQAGAEHFQITLHVQSGGSQGDAFMDTTPPIGGVNRRPIVTAKIGEAVRVVWRMKSQFPHGTMKGVTIHFFVVREENLGQKPVPNPAGPAGILDNSFVMDFKPDASANGSVRLRLTEAGNYLIRVQSEDTHQEHDHEHFSAIDLKVE